MQREFGARGLQALACDFTEDAIQQLPSFIQKLQPPFPVGFAPRDAANNYLQVSVMNPGYVPKLVLIDRTGTIRYQYDGSDPFFQFGTEKALREKIEEMLGPAKAAAAPRAGTASKAESVKKAAPPKK